MTKLRQVWVLIPGMRREWIVMALAVVFVSGPVAPQSSQAQTLTVLYTFRGGTDGGYPSGLVRDAAGNLYGTTAEGGSYTCNFSFGCGTIFKLDPAGKETVLYRFTGLAGDGANPFAGLTRDAVGNLYGVTSFGGGACNCGTVFELDTIGKAKVLYSFAGGLDGKFPVGVMRDALGNFYGTTSAGGGSACSGLGCGTVFKLDTTGKETILYRFTGAGDGASPNGGLNRDARGNFYGTTGEGGGTGCAGGLGCGTVFKLDPSGNETVLYSFTDIGGDGTGPNGGLVADAAGNLYGTTTSGGTSFGGTIFKVGPTGQETVLYSFTGGFSGGPDGGYPFAGLVQDPAGNLYGTTMNGGGNRCLGSGCGTVFELDTSGEEVVLHRLAIPEGTNPESGLIRDSAGNLYGVAPLAGKRRCPQNQGGCGTVFKLVP